MELSINDIIALLSKRLVLITACTLSGLCMFFILSRCVIHSSYTASVQMYVNANDTTSSIDLNDLYYAQKVVTTYINFLKTKVFYAEVIEESKLDYTTAELNSMTEINSVNNTEIFQISVTSDSAEDSYKLVSAMQNVVPELIKSIKTSAEISVVDPVAYPTGPSGPNILLNTAIGGLLGLFLSISIALLWEILNVNVKNQEELKRKYNKPILGAIPDYGENNKRRNLLQILHSRIYRKNSRSDKVVADDSDFMITEAYKELRTNLRYTLIKDGCKKILINSPISQDGKSTISSNVGISIAQTGARVLLIDCDMRKGRLHNFFNISNSPGISELVSGISKEKDVIQNTFYENLQVITMGMIPPNPTELLASGQMEEILKVLEKNYDFIILDSPPVNVVSDALCLIKLVDGVILVVRENYTSHPNIAGAISKLEFIEAKILGFVYNGISIKRGNMSKSKYYNYYNSKDD